jgi:hypothetical protein
VDEESVIVEDCLEDEDEEDAVPTGRSSSLSPLTTPFFPALRSAGRSKAQRWREDSSDPDLDWVQPSSPYLEATHRAVEATASAGSRDGGSPVSRPVVISKKQRRRRCRRHARSREAAGPPVAPNTQPIGCPCANGSAPSRPHVCLCTCAYDSGRGHRCRATAFPVRLRPSTMMASCWFKVVDAGAAMACLTLIANGQCRLRSLVSASTVWRQTTSPPG